MSNHTKVVDGAGALLDEEAAAKYLKMTRRFMQSRRQCGDSPAYIRISARAIRYRICDLDAWVEEHLCNSTAESATREDRCSS